MDEPKGDASGPPRGANDGTIPIRKQDAVPTEKKHTPAEGIIERIRQHRWATLIIVVGTITIAVGTFFDAVTKITAFVDRFSDAQPTTVTELQNTVRASALELKDSFEVLTAGRTPPIPDSDFDRVNSLITRIERLDPGNGHVIYYRGFITRWRNQRLASHSLLFWYLERAKDPSMHLAGDNGDARFCFDNWVGYCKQRQAYINHVVALDFQQAAKEEKDPAVVLARLKAALERAEMAINLYGEFIQGTPTRTLAEALKRQISEAEKALSNQQAG